MKQSIIMKIAFDLDGTLYDTLPRILEVDRAIRKDLGYQDVSQEEYKSKFQSRDWNKFYRDLGIRDEHLDEVINGFVERFKLSNSPEMIPGAREVLQKAEQELGHKNIHIVTNETPEGVKKRFERDGLLHYLDRVDNPFQGKSEELYRLATSNNGSPLFYIGDLVSDGEDCKEARKKGADNLRFCGIVHQYAMNTEEAMRIFVKGNRDFAQVLNNLNEVERLWNQK